MAAVLVAVVGCRSTGVSEEAELGRELVAQIRREHELLHDPAVVGYVRELGLKLVQAAGVQPFRYRFYVVEDMGVDAFAVPGGHIFVSTGALLSARGSTDLAAILTHEIGHVVLRHAIKTLDRQQVEAYRVAAKKSRTLNPVWKEQRRTIGTVFSNIHFNWEQEMEADRFAARTLRIAGYCPAAMADLLTHWSGSEEEERARATGPLVVPPVPPLAIRIGELEPEIERLGPCSASAPNTTDPLFAVQARLREAQ